MACDEDSNGLDGDESKVCSRCRYFLEITIDTEGECRRFAPQPRQMRFAPRRSPHDDYVPEWPTVNAGDWCGEFEENPLKVSDSWE